MELGNGRAVLMTEGLPAPSEGEVYEAWLLRDGVPEPAGLFESHHGMATMPYRGLYRRLRRCGGDRRTLGWLSSVPTSEPLLTATL